MDGGNPSPRNPRKLNADKGVRSSQENLSKVFGDLFPKVKFHVIQNYQSVAVFENKVLQYS